jgi:ribosomal 50S subunit-associated protein YjgA (DUF615 family)
MALKTHEVMLSLTQNKIKTTEHYMAHHSSLIRQAKTQKEENKPPQLHCWWEH